ncbi:MAG: hypothetical protein E6K65_06700 [Nitrospirae bacterium]|nr:MAG: hypothetical protein E6K65_06700 [Nitrospirota bacterium]
MPQHSKKRARALIPKTSNRYKVRVLTPHSFTVENIQRPSKRGSQTPTRSAALEKANIERVVNEFMRLSDKRIDVSETASIFCHRLLEDDPSALALLQRLLRPRKESIIDKWEREAEAADSSSEPIIDEQSDKWLKAWWQVDGPKLTPQQRQIIEDLSAQRQRLHSVRSRLTKNSKNMEDVLRDYDTLVCDAIRNGLEDYPWCLEWIIQHRIFSDRKSLHRLHRSHPKLESGVPRLLSIAGGEATVLKEVLQLRSKNRKPSLRSIHRILQTRNLYKKPWSTFQKWISNPWRRAIIDPTP